MAGAAVSARLLAERNSAVLAGLVDENPPLPDEPPDEDDPAGAKSARAGEKSAAPSQATRLVQLAIEQYELGVTPDGEPYAVPASGPRVVRMLRGGRGSLRAELARRYYATAGVTPSQSALADACMVLEGMAQQIDPVELHLRVARHAGRLVLDLGDPTGQAVIISTEAWRVVEEPPVRFRRTALTGALPEPIHGGSLDALWAAINVAERYRPILAGVLVAALMPNLPHPVVAITGEQAPARRRPPGGLPVCWIRPRCRSASHRGMRSPPRPRPPDPGWLPWTTSPICRAGCRTACVGGPPVKATCAGGSTPMAISM